MNTVLDTKKFTPDQSNAFIFIIVMVVAYLVVFYFCHQRYTTARDVRFAMAYTEELKDQVDRCMLFLNGYNYTPAIASGCEISPHSDIGLIGASQYGKAVLPAGMGVPQVYPAAIGRTPIVTATFGNSAAQSLIGKIIIFSKGDRGGWTCASTISDGYRPEKCQFGPKFYPMEQERDFKVGRRELRDLRYSIIDELLLWL